MTTSRPNIVGLGEVLWDLFPDGPRFGGAPANFACHAAALGAEAWMVGAVGTDEPGARALRLLQERGVHTLLLHRDPEHATGSVDVRLDAQGRASYVFADDPAWDHAVWNESIALLAGRCDAVCFGSLAQRAPATRRMIREFVETTRPEALRVFDVNLRQSFWSHEVIETSLQLANVLKLNHEELPVVARLLSLPTDETAFMEQAAECYELRMIALTRGSGGSVLWQDGRTDIRTAPRVAVVDTVGAGDAFTAGLVTGLLRGEPLSRLHQRAVDVAAFVCTRSGAVPEIPAELGR